MSTETPLFTDYNAVALLAFTSNAKIIRYKSVNEEPSLSTVRTLIKTLLSSISITEALSSVSAPNEHALNQAASDRNTHAPRASISLDGGGFFAASRIEDDVWLGIIFARFIIHANEVADAIVPALLDAAEDLVVSAVKDAQAFKGVVTKPFCLWLAMLKSVASANKWNRDKCAVQIKLALIVLAERYVKRKGGPPFVLEDIAQREEYIQPFATEFRSQVAKATGVRPDVLCIMSDSSTIWYSRNMTTRQEQSVLWYYAHIVNHGSRAAPRYVFELDDNRMMRLWYARHGLILYAHLNLKETATKLVYKALGQVALDVLRAAEEYKPT